MSLQDGATLDDRMYAAVALVDAIREDVGACACGLEDGDLPVLLIEGVLGGKLTDAVRNRNRG